jgi:hypothetical protein
MAWATFGIAILALLLHFLPRKTEKSEPISFALPTLPKRQLKRPKVRDEMAGWRQEQEERYHWESELRAKEQ